MANEPKILEDFAIWEKDLFKLAMGLPKWMAKDAHLARERIIRAFMKWGVAEKGMTRHVRKISDMSIARGLDQWDLAATNFGFWMA
jgi:hypothetical protein